MDCQSTDIFEIWRALSVLTLNGVNEIDKGLKDQTLKLDVISNNLLKSLQINFSGSPEKKIPKRQSKTNKGDLFAAEPSFQQPAVPPIRRTKRQASIAASKNARESATISSSGASTRASRARGLSTFMDVGPLDCPKANSTFVVDKKLMEGVEECLSPEMFSPIKKSIEQQNPNTTYDVSNKSKRLKGKKDSGQNMNLIPEETAICEKISKAAQKSSSKDISGEPQIKSKRREKLEDIDVNNFEGQATQHMTRTMKRKILDENQIGAKKTNAVRVPLEQISTPLKPSDDLLTPRQVRENEAEKRKELYLKTKADKKKFDENHLKAANQREEHAKFLDEKLKKSNEEKRKKEEKQKERDLMLKAEKLKKQKLAAIRLEETNIKRKLAEEAKLLKIQQKAELERKEKEAEIKKKNELKSEKSKTVATKILQSKIPTSSPKVVGLPKSKVEKSETNKNDYGLNDVSARDSSEDESVPKKPVPIWAKQENRKAVLELQYHVDSNERDLFFNCPKTLSLKEMFKGWNIRDRQRTSSAVWKTPPRYSEYIRNH